LCCTPEAGTCRAAQVWCDLPKVQGNWGSIAGNTPKDACCVDPLKCSDWTEDVDAARKVKVSILIGVSLTGAFANALM
jgi:hypothetical protein